MKKFFRNKLNQSGFHHGIIVGVAFVVLFGIIGTYFFITSHAATSTYEVSNGNTYCINDPGNQGQTLVTLQAQPCNQTSRQIFQLIDGSGGASNWHEYQLFYNTSQPLCIGSDGGSTKPGTRLQARACNNGLTLYVNTNNQLEVGSSGGICVDSASGQMTLSNCSNAGTWNPKAKSVQASGGGGSSLLGSYTSGFIGVPYVFGGGHAEGWAAFNRNCPNPNSGNSACEVDCSTLVSYVVDKVYGTSWDWTVDDNTGDMVGSGSSHWHSVGMSNVEPGDIVTTPGHVEFFVAHTGSTITTFGAHNPSKPDGFDYGIGANYYNQAFRYE